eukprot:m.232812 g.232812  ORF g.232812 m.232812 type:complete len:208 (+) comp18888_c0_seq15:321-944(+)
MGEVSYVRAPPSGLVDHAAAIVDIVGTPPQLVGDSPIAMAGFAHKHGFRFCSWRKRFFRLRNDVIEYYRRMDSKAAKGVIRLSPLCRCWECHVGDPRHPKAFGYVKLVDGRPVVEVVQRPHGVVVFVPEQHFFWSSFCLVGAGVLHSFLERKGTTVVVFGHCQQPRAFASVTSCCCPHDQLRCVRELQVHPTSGSILASICLRSGFT